MEENQRMLKRVSMLEAAVIALARDAPKERLEELAVRLGELKREKEEKATEAELVIRAESRSLAGELADLVESMKKEE